MSQAELEQARRPSMSENQTIQSSDIPLKERFFRYFQHEITALQGQMDTLADTSLVGGERTDATDHCLAGIARLSNEVKDAASYIPTYDQRIYAEAIKALQDKLAETRATVEPRPKFSFKNKRNSPGNLLSLPDTASMMVQGQLGIGGYPSPGASSVGSSGLATPNYVNTPLNEPDKQLHLLRQGTIPSSVPEVTVDNVTDRLSKKQPNQQNFAAQSVNAVTVNDHTGLHIMLPSSGSTAAVPASVTAMDRCVVDMSIPTANGKPYASLMVKTVSDSLLLCGQIDGPAHLTGVRNSIIVVDCRQFRMHDCNNVDVYLSSSSNPIIEDCTDIRFGRIPKGYQALDHDRLDTDDRWSLVEDFKWIKPEPSPNWSLLGQDDGVPQEVWTEIVPGGPCWSCEEILRAVNILKH
ncbi:Putative Function: cofactor C of H. sapiens is a tubulin-folding protein [Aspergillus calidoustus]|uniref:Putative Function: cofactor C of H. sapiens is a tubulin-folding protein n=1 Tax=Aspergillus calidoustus TaxID=454130 RepID=A0A0U5G8A7_ASPCI|nr:Putative Function: cofactor C of H. sapiens is a tubulin-folding protein [Aspergillus calidoustus]